MTTHPSVSASAELLLIPVSQLRPSSRNVRKTGAASITELASSIARVGLLQNLTVTAAPDGEHYDVVAGRRRLAALRLLAKRRQLAKEHEVPCLVVADTAARTVSLTENIQREAMHPADQFEAFAALVADGRPIEDIAADFGVTPLVVRRRLKLANVSPRLLADYRANEVTLDQLMALAITDDHAAQEAAFYESSPWQRSPQALREHLTAREIDAARDPLARFVGVEAYEMSGGGVRRDLFSDGESGTYLADAALLDSLARERLGPIVVGVKSEGWAWVEAATRVACADLHAFRRVQPERRTPTKAEAKRLAKLEARQQAIDERLGEDESEEIPEEEARALYEEGDRLDAEREAIGQSLRVYAPDVIATSGALVTIDHAGEVVVHRGLLREADVKASEAKAARANGAIDPDKSSPVLTTPGLSEKLARRLSAHRTAALQAEVARHPQVALAALVHRLALRIVCDDYGAHDAVVNVSASPRDRLDADAPDIAQSLAFAGMREVREAWAARLPVDSDALLAHLLALPQADLLSLLAVCVASTIDATTARDDVQPAVALAKAVELDMHAWWTPTAASYFAQVSKAKTLEAMQTIAPEHVTRLCKLKKEALASEAERLAAGTGWLPPMLREQNPTPKVGLSNDEATA